MAKRKLLYEIWVLISSLDAEGQNDLEWEGTINFRIVAYRG